MQPTDKSIGQRKHFGSGSGSDESGRVTHATYSVQSTALPIYIAALGVLICGLIGYVLLKCRLKRLTKTPPCAPPGHLYAKCTSVTIRPTMAANYTPLAKVPTPGHLYRQASERMSHKKGQGWQSGLLEPHRPPHMTRVDSFRRDSYRFSAVKSLTRSASSAHTASTSLPSSAGSRYCDIASNKKRALEASLNSSRSDTRDWKGLAKELGYEQEQVAKFEMLGKERHGPTRHLLNDWSKGDFSNVTDLVGVLFKIGRHDSAYIVDPTCMRIKYSGTTPGYMV